MWPVTIQRFLKEIYFTVRETASFLVMALPTWSRWIIWWINSQRKGSEGRTRWSSKLKFKDKIGKVKHSQVRKEGKISRRHVLNIWIHYISEKMWLWKYKMFASLQNILLLALRSYFVGNKYPQRYTTLISPGSGLWDARLFGASIGKCLLCQGNLV